MRHDTPKFIGRLMLSALLAASMFTACSSQNSRRSQREMQVEYIYHTVSYPGETLGTIAKWYTGSANNWLTIRDHNPGLNERRLRMGTMIAIPRSLVSNDRPMPKSVTIKNDPSLSSGTPPPPQANIQTQEESSTLRPPDENRAETSGPVGEESSEPSAAVPSDSSRVESPSEDASNPAPSDITTENLGSDTTSDNTKDETIKDDSTPPAEKRERTRADIIHDLLHGGK